MIFGSDSDWDKVKEGVTVATKCISGLEVEVDFASADNTSVKVDRIASKIKCESIRNKVYISGAGMSNVLTGVLKSQANLGDLIIGIALDDSKTYGMSSWLSTSEKPPGNPVLMVGLNDSYSALNISYRFLSGIDKNEVVVFGGTGEREIFPSDRSKLEDSLEEIELHYQVKKLNQLDADDIVLTVFSMVDHEQGKGYLNLVDNVLRKGQGIQIGMAGTNIGLPSAHYLHCLINTETTGIVGIQAYQNAAHLAARIIRDENSLSIIGQKKNEKAHKLNQHPGLLVSGGEVVEKGIYDGEVE